MLEWTGRLIMCHPQEDPEDTPYTVCFIVNCGQAQMSLHLVMYFMYVNMAGTQGTWAGETALY